MALIVQFGKLENAGLVTSSRIRESDTSLVLLFRAGTSVLLTAHLLFHIALKHDLDEGERVKADAGYVGEASIKAPGPLHTNKNTSG